MNVLVGARSDFIHTSFKMAGFLVEENRPLKVCSFIPFTPTLSSRFIFTVEIPRVLPSPPLNTLSYQLHCTIINTVYRKPKPRDGKRIPFAYPDLLTSPWFSRSNIGSSRPPHKTVPQRSLQSGSDVVHLPGRGPISVDFGTWDIDEVQICEMGSHGPEGEYVCVGKISL